MEVYRVEHLLTGDGPYTNGDQSINAALDAGFTSNHPAPCDDGIWSSHSEGFDYPQYRYGFESVESLLNWFDSDAMQVLFDNGYVVATYYVPGTAVRLGYCHLAFNHDRARVLRLDDTLPVEA
jgi:hypothetical protein